MLRKFLGITLGATAFLVLSLGGGGELLAQNQGETLIQDPDEPVTRVGNRGGAFLALGVGARANALAGAGSTITEGVHALYWNPAATAATEGFSVAFTYAELYKDSDINHIFTGAMIPFGGGVLGLSLNTLTSGEIPRTVETTPSGENVGIGTTFEWTSSAIGLHYSRLITDRLSLGGTGKWVNEGIDGAETNWVAFDLGVKFKTGLYGTTLSGVVANISGKSEMGGALIEQRRTGATEFIDETGRTLDLALETTALALPTSFTFGLQVDLAGTPEALMTPDPRHKLVALLDVRDATDTDIQTTFALEYGYNELLFLRGGKKWLNENFGCPGTDANACDASFVGDRSFGDGLSLGFGVKVPALGRNLGFDYAYTWLVEGLERVQVFSFEYGF